MMATNLAYAAQLADAMPTGYGITWPCAIVVVAICALLGVLTWRLTK